MEPLSRPDPTSTLAERARSWATWFGIGRLVAASVATVVVAVGAVWLVRSPPPATEATLPYAATTTTSAEMSTPSSSPVRTDAATATEVLVHVAGAVARPGVYELGPDARVRDALVAAGGPSGQADADALNLAAPVGDGSRIYVPLVGEQVAGPLLTGGGATADPTAGGAPSAPIDVNRATADELDALPGVGPATATAIVTERERNGPFVSVDDLERVPGIGPAKLDGLRDLVTT